MCIRDRLYTVREHTKTLEDFSRTLEKIAAIGYRNVQVSGTCAYEPAWLKAELDRTGLRCVLTHTCLLYTSVIIPFVKRLLTGGCGKLCGKCE